MPKLHLPENETISKINTHQKFGRYEEALKLCKQGRKSYPSLANLARLQALALAQLGKMKKARVALDRAVQLGLPKGRLLQTRLKFSEITGDIDRQIVLLKKLVQQSDGADAVWMLKLADVTRRSGDARRSIEVLDEVAAHWPDAKGTAHLKFETLFEAYEGQELLDALDAFLFGPDSTVDNLRFLRSRIKTWRPRVLG